MTPLEWFGLAADADERMVKRAYALRLRDTRPEDDQEGFQHLHSIYQAALEQCRHAVASALVTSKPVSAPPASVKPTPKANAGLSPSSSPSPPAFDASAFTDSTIRHAGFGDAEALHDWLCAEPALWSLSLKQQVGLPLLQYIAEVRPPMPAACFQVILRFFGLDDALLDHDPLVVQRLEQGLQLAWELQPDHRGTLAQRLGLNSSWQRADMDRWLQQLARSYHAWQAGLYGSVPDRVVYLAKFVTQLTWDNIESLPTAFDQRQANFWLLAADGQRVSAPRLLIGGFRCLALLLCAALFGGLLSIAGSAPDGSLFVTPLLLSTGVTAACCLLWLLWMAWLPLDNWLGAPEYEPVRWPWLNLLLIPALCALGLAVWLGAHTNPWAWLPMVIALWLSFRRCLRRGVFANWKVNPRGLWLAMWLAISWLGHQSGELVSGEVFFPVAGTALLFWAIDLWRHRYQLRLRPASTS
ncbi:MAG TPA: hypothetical protein VFN09_07620 [Rhodanobacteraceae bacterium]|nr:hypothetical protein [Rhodanobacteraceae bacterium]